MTRTTALLGSALFLVLAPGTIAGLVPWLVTRWAPPPGATLMTFAGGVLLALGGTLLVDCFTRFALEGRGTPAPIAPTRHLVVTGAYRYVRNPMYVAVVSLILGQAVMFASLPLLAYGLAVWAASHAFVLAYEEPTLRRQFPDDYQAYLAGVPRWIPRLSPWRG